MCDAPNQGTFALREEIAKLYPNVHPDEVLVTTGTGEALFLAFQILVKPKTKFSVLWPAFQSLYEIPLLLGGEMQKIEVGGPLSAKLWESLSVDLHIINHPHNPTGQSFPEEEWTKLLQFLDRENTIVLFDEHYRFLPEGGGLGKTGVDPKKGRYGTGSFTKCFGVTGLRVGWFIAERDVIRRARSFKDYLTHTVNPVSERIALGLLQNKKKFLPIIQRRVRKNQDLLSSLWKELPKIKHMNPVMGGLVGWLTLEEGVRSEVYADILYEKTGVFVLPGKNFEKEGFLRVGFGETISRFREGIERWKQCSSLL